MADFVNIALSPSLVPLGTTSSIDMNIIGQVGATDTTPPVFAGVTGVATLGGVVRLTWNAATDTVTATNAITYEVHVDMAPGASWSTRAVVSASEVLPDGWEFIEGPIECRFDLEHLAPGLMYYFRVRAKDEAGNVSSNTQEVSAHLPTDITPPTINNFFPAPGTPIRHDSVIGFDVTDDAGLVHVELRVSHGEVVETVYNGEQFVGRYTGSSRQTISGGYRFSIIRTSGWLHSPTFTVSAVDTAGNKL